MKNNTKALADPQKPAQPIGRSLKLVLSKLKLDSLFRDLLTDPRGSRKTYSVESLLLCGILIHLLQLGSRHAFQDGLSLSPAFQHNIMHLIGASSVPSQKTLEDLFLDLDPQELAQVLPALFSGLIQHKIFKNHPELLHDGYFVLAIDGTHSHTYHSNSQHPTAGCPYCLRRTNGDRTYFLHFDVVLSAVFPFGTFPLAFHRVRKQARYDTLSHEKFKEECELTSLENLLKDFRSHFPKLKCLILLDSLYANATAIALCEKYHIKYLITRKDGSLRSLSDDIEGLKKLQQPITSSCSTSRWTAFRTAHLFTDLTHKDHKFSLIEIFERATKNPSHRLARTTTRDFHCQWITNIPTSSEQAEPLTRVARRRQCQEDYFNTIKNRHFAMEHDMSRSPYSQIIWLYLLLIASAVTFLLSITALESEQRMKVSFKNWITQLLAILLTMSGILLTASLPKQWRLRMPIRAGPT